IDTLTDPRYGFDQYRKIRFRSSTNVEDSEHFTGAGLYDSYSGCLADELDGDESGPSRCDPDKNNERGVFRAIRRVFASFYNDNAYLERLRHGIDENDVGMALLVHHSFPDEIELANGVATLEVRKTGPSRYLTDIRMVTQDGAVSVANPDPGVIPEEVTVSRSLPTEPIYPRLRTVSNLVPLGSTVMDWTADYVQLSELLFDAAAEFSRISAKSEYILDFEYKKVSTGEGLVVKQIREIPRQADTGTMTTMLINEPMCFCLYQGEYGSMFGYHRLKSTWQMQTRSLWLSEENLTESLLGHVDFEYLAGLRVRSMGGMPEFWPHASHTYEITGPGRAKVNDEWLMHHLGNPRRMTVEAEGMPVEVSDAGSPVVTLGDFAWYGWPHMTLRVEYNEPVPEYDYHLWPDSLGSTKVDIAGLWPCPRQRPDDRLQQRVLLDNDRGIRIETSFYWPIGPVDDPGGYTAPLVRWVETTMTGLTSTPITLNGWYSQSYLPGHHNLLEFFIFEPQLENGIDPEILEELRAKDACVIFAFGPRDEHNTITAPIATYKFADKPHLAADADADKDVDWRDYAVLFERWLDVRCDECGGADLTGDGRVGYTDLREFAFEWLGSLD
ncbi:MAG: PEP/pyruvate-binding domain-containing protein, partial [Planctomycetota bacterium]